MQNAKVRVLPDHLWKAGQSGNPAGRPKDIDRIIRKPTRRELRERELLMVLRKLRPHIAESIVTASNIMGNANAKDENKLKAAIVIVDNYRKLVLDLYDGKEDPELDNEEGQEIQQENGPQFSLKMVKDASSENTA